jgi:hypothetical protein
MGPTEVGIELLQPAQIFGTPRFHLSIGCQPEANSLREKAQLSA